MSIAIPIRLSLAAAVCGVLFSAVANAATPTATPTAVCALGATCEAETASRGGGVVVSTLHSGYTGSGFADYPGNGTGYVEWTVNIPTAGTYSLSFRYANGGTGDRPMTIAVNGTTAISSLSFPVTGSWTNWTARAQSLTLPAGPVRIRATELPNGPNVDSLTVSQTGTPRPTPTATGGSCAIGVTCEAETAVRGGGVVVSALHAGYTGSGFADYPGNGSGYVEWTVDAPVTGTYSLSFRYANGGSADRPMAIAVNGATAVASLSFPVTTSWTNWSVRTQNVSLPMGLVKIRATELPNGPNVDSLTVTALSATPTPWSTGYMKISVSKVDLQVGDTITVTVSGNTGLGSFNLGISGDPIFAETPAPSPNNGGTTYSWTLTAARPGTASFYASVYGETQFGCTSCFAWTTVSAASSTVTVHSAATPTPTPAPQGFLSITVWDSAADFDPSTHNDLVVRADTTAGAVAPTWSVKVIDVATGLEQDPGNPIVTLKAQGATTPPSSSSMEWWRFTRVRPGSVTFQASVYAEFPCGPSCFAYQTVTVAK